LKNDGQSVRSVVVLTSDFAFEDYHHGNSKELTSDGSEDHEIRHARGHRRPNTTANNATTGRDDVGIFLTALLAQGCPSSRNLSANQHHLRSQFHDSDAGRSYYHFNRADPARCGDHQFNEDRHFANLAF
jgi:hypothetical protein